jgi:hypothetical protein
VASFALIRDECAGDLHPSRQPPHPPLEFLTLHFCDCRTLVSECQGSNWGRDDACWNRILVQSPRSAGDGGIEEPAWNCCSRTRARHAERAGAGALYRHAAGPWGAARCSRRSAAVDAAGGACRWGRREMVELPISRGAAVKEPDAEPWATPLARANLTSARQGVYRSSVKQIPRWSKFRCDPHDGPLAWL